MLEDDEDSVDVEKAEATTQTQCVLAQRETQTDAPREERKAERPSTTK